MAKGSKGLRNCKPKFNGDVSDLKDELLKVQSAIEYKNQNLNPSTTAYEIW